MKEVQQRSIYIDILRMIACFFVIANHTNYVFEQAEMDCSGVSMRMLVGATFYLAICKCAVTIFLMISGSLLLRKVDDYKKAMARVVRVVVTIVLFSVPYYLIGDFEHSLFDFCRVVGRASVTTAYWYLYLYLGILVMMPMLQRFVRQFEKKDFCYFFFFTFLCTFSFVTEFNVNFKLPIFATYIGIAVLGYYLDQFVECKKNWVLPSIVGIIGLLLLLTGYTIYRVKAERGYAATLLQYDNVFYIAIAAGVFMLVKYVVLKKPEFFDERKNAVITRVGSDTFGIYLVSDFVIHYLKPYFERWNNILAVIALDVIVFAVGLAVTAILKKIPLIKNLL